jgi:hypothetical protein
MTGQYKFVVSPPTDGDPPTNPISTTDELIGVQPPQVLVESLPNPYQFGAIGDGTSDDTTSIQAWLDGIANGAGFWKAGTFAISDTVHIRSDTKIYGAGRGVATLKAASGFPSNKQLLTNVAVGDKNISISDCGFQGDSNAVTSVEMLGFGSIDTLILRDCLFQHWRRFLTTFSSCTHVTVNNCEFYDWGSLDVVPTPGACLFDGGYALWFGTGNSDINIINNFMHDGQWHAILAEGERFLIQGNRIYSTREGGIFCPGLNFSSILGNTISGVARKDCAACGIEFQGTRVNINDNLINATGQFSILISDSYLINVEDNICDGSSTETDGIETVSCVIGVRSLGSGGPSGQGPNSITISNNHIFDRRGMAAHGIGFFKLGFPNAKFMDSIMVQGNNLGPNDGWRVSPMLFFEALESVSGVDFMIRNNQGGAQYDLSTNNISFLIPSGTTGSFRVGGVGFRASAIDFQAVLPNNAGTMASISMGQGSWLTVWDVATQTIVDVRNYFNANSIGMATDGTFAVSNARVKEASINIIDQLAHPVCVAGVTALDDDGFTLTINSSAAVSAVDNAGTGYVVGDTGSINGGTTPALYRVTAIGGGGSVTAANIDFAGEGYITTADAATTNGGSQPGVGVGLTFDVFSSSPTTAAVVVAAICHA